MPAEHHPRICPECGKPIAAGSRAKTCSEACRRERLRKQKRARYELYRGTDEFKAERATYLEKLKERRAADPEFNAQVAAAHKAAVQKAVSKRNADPARRESQLKQMRDWKAGASEEQKEKLRAANRAWYASLSPEAKAAHIAAKAERRRKRKATQNGAGDRITLAGPGPKYTSPP